MRRIVTKMWIMFSIGTVNLKIVYNIGSFIYETFHVVDRITNWRLR